jgi:hypothetical protein
MQDRISFPAHDEAWLNVLVMENPQAHLCRVVKLTVENSQPSIVSLVITRVPTPEQVVAFHGPGFTSVFGANTLAIEPKIVSHSFL